jgi:hypothetical protein
MFLFDEGGVFFSENALTFDYAVKSQGIFTLKIAFLFSLDNCLFFVCSSRTGSFFLATAPKRKQKGPPLHEKS